MQERDLDPELFDRLLTRAAHHPLLGEIRCACVVLDSDGTCVALDTNGYVHEARSRAVEALAKRTDIRAFIVSPKKEQVLEVSRDFHGASGIRVYYRCRRPAEIVLEAGPRVRLSGLAR